MHLPHIRHAAFLSVALTLLALVSPTSAQTLTYEKYKLDNGLTVILHVDHSLPVSTINLWYRVGAKNEPASRSGFAHLFEHLMFMGTKRVPGSQFDILMESGGGNNNATTDLDRTNYFSEGPAELLPTLLWLDADRMEALGANMTTEKLNKQRDIVRNEIRQQVENTPYGRAYEGMFRFMYPAGHPYHNAVYGTHADLESATQNDVRDFFATFYNPSNCSLVVAGDFDPAAIKPMVANLFGSLPAGNAPKDRKIEPAKLDRLIRSTILDKVELPKLLMVYHAPGQYQPGDAEITLASQVLGDGQSSRLYQRLVLKDQTCAEVAAYPYPGQLQSLFLIDVSAKPGVDLAKVEKAIDEEVARLRDSGPTPEELAQRKATLELGMISSLQSVQARADKLNEYEYYFGEPDSLQRDLDRFRKASVTSVRDAAKNVITPEARLIMTVLPEEGNTEPSARDQQPSPASQPVAFQVPTPETFVLDSGVKVVLFHKPELPLVSASLLAKPQTLTINPPAKAGRSELLSQMMEEGTGDLDGPAFAAALQSLGGEFDSSASRTSLTTSLTVLDRNFPGAAKLWLDATLRPRMLGSDLDRVKELHLADLDQEDQKPGMVAAKVGQMLLFGVDNAYGVPQDGTAATVAALTMDDLKAAQSELLATPARLTLFVAGNVTQAQLKAALNPLIPSTPTASADAPQHLEAKPAPATSLRVIIVNRPDAPQTAVRVMAPGIEYGDKARIPLELMNTVLGGSFTSRLNANLREDKGYTYGSGSRFITDPHTGWFVASADVKADVTGPSIKEMLSELKKITGGDVTAEELAKARQSYRADLVGRFATLRSLLGTASGLEVAGVPFTSLATDLREAESATADSLNNVAKQYPKLDQGLLILVGDEPLIREQIKDLGLPPALSYDASGKPVADAQPSKE
jgi:zinc protease